MGSLYLAKDPKIGRLVAIKLVRQEFDSPDARQRFAREAQSAGTLRHPNIVTIFDVDEHDGLPFIAMEYIDGETLGEIVKRKALLPIAEAPPVGRGSVLRSGLRASPGRDSSRHQARQPDGRHRRRR